MNTLVNSPFKFLNAFEKKDADLFFGREKETEALYELTFDTRLILLYGASGTGKTSLVQCGLANKFSETRWKELFIRRDYDINNALRVMVNREIIQMGGLYTDEEDIIVGLKKVYQLSFKPLYLIFDQFEELFILRPDEGEQLRFFEFVSTLLGTNLPCKIILVMREEFIAHLWDFEKIVPSLFEHRYRVERMRFSSMENVVSNTLEKMELKDLIKTQELKLLSKKILEHLIDGKGGLELTYLQVYLDRLYQAAERTNGNKVPHLTPSVVDQMGSFEDIIGDFLIEQLEQLENNLGKNRKGIPIKILGAMVTDEKTKKVLSKEDLESIRQQYHLSEEELESCLQAFEQMRILRRYD